MGLSNAALEGALMRVEAELVSVNAVGEMLGLSQAAVWRGVLMGRLPQPLRIGRSVRWRKREIEAWIEHGCPLASEWTWPPEGKEELR
jgi:predicted DNA-binding transcriptional regulator AlpA